MRGVPLPLLLAPTTARAAPPLKPNATGAKFPPKEGTVRVVVGGSVQASNPLFEYFRGFPPGGVKFITAAGTNPTGDATSLSNLLTNAGAQDPEWIPVYHDNCAARTRDPEYIKMVEDADAIFLGGGQSGRLQSCMFGNYQQSGIDGVTLGKKSRRGEVTPFLRALLAKTIVGGSSAGAMNQPQSEILITGHSVESYSALRAGSVFQRSSGNFLLSADELVDTHFSERGRQARLMIIAMQTHQKWAFGIDENTAYLWRPSGEYEIVGENGVVVYEGTEGTSQSQRAVMHFLTQGDRIIPSSGRIIYNPDKVQCTGTRPSGSNSIFSGVNYRTISIAMAKSEAGTTLDTYHGSPTVQVTFTSASNTVAMCGPSGDSFENLLVEQFQSSSFVNLEKPELPQDHVWEVDE